MTSLDMVRLGLENLLRTRLRTVLTILGVVVGIGALTSMVSFGTGMQKNITEAFKESDLFTSLYVTAGDIGEITDPDDVMDLMKRPPTPLTDSTVIAIRQIPGVEMAFPEITFPVRVEIDGHETRTTLRGLPAAMGRYRPFSELEYGEYFSGDDDWAAVVRLETLEDMGLSVTETGVPSAEAPADSAVTLEVVAGDSLIGSTIKVVTAVMDLSGGPMSALTRLLPGRGEFREAVREFEITGILKQASSFSGQGFHGGIFVPIKTADSIPTLGFSSVWELLGRDHREGMYGSIYVRVEGMDNMEAVRTVLTDEMGLPVFSISDQLAEIRRGFLIVDSVLAAVGTVALFVAALGIVNTMVMSILERTREIGIMKAIGAGDGEIRAIFFAEAATIGAVGGVCGLVLGWLVTRLANVVVNARLLPAGEEPVNLFYFPLWLILGAVAFSILVSLVAGLYPAGRAARVDPVKALRHD
jgi:putative ABC transport system permease protein